MTLPEVKKMKKLKPMSKNEKRLIISGVLGVILFTVMMADWSIDPTVRFFVGVLTTWSFTYFGISINRFNNE